MRKKPLKQAPGQTISVRVDVEQYKELAALASERDRHIGGELRRAIRFYLEAQAK